MCDSAPCADNGPVHSSASGVIDAPLDARGDATAPKPYLVGSAAPVPLEATLHAYGATTDVGGAAVRFAHSDSHAGGGRVRLTRQAREDADEALLAPGATRARGAGERAVTEESDEYRTCFERDLDRIKHSKAFRRLAGKCQVFIAPEDDHLRTRMTHAIEVAQVARGLATVLGLNVALTEAIALAHDCGHGPAGHASEDAFSPFLPTGIYDHAVWGADVTLRGLNLCWQTLDGVRTHSWKLPAPATPEGEVVSWADRIAYVCHDFDDAQVAGIVTVADLPAEVRDIAGERQSRQIGAFINGMIEATSITGRVGMLEEPARALEAFRRFNYERIYLRPAAQQQTGRAITMLRGLVDYYATHIDLLPADSRLGAIGQEEIAAGTAEALAASVHYVSGMTDRFAIRAARELLGWDDNQLPAPGA